MKHLFALTDLAHGPWLESVPENTEVLLTGQPFSNSVRVFVPIGHLVKSEELANKIGVTVHGRRWARITRNDGHYIEVETEDYEQEQEASSAKSNPRT
jgi:hypothetical protein